MRVTEQIDALRTLAAHPIDYLVVPRFLAMLLVMPLLTAGSVCVGIFAAYVVGAFLCGVNPTYLWYNMIHYTDMNDILTGMIKTFAFGAIIAVIACDKGLELSARRRRRWARHHRGGRLFLHHHSHQ